MCLEQYKTCMKSISKSLLLYKLSFDFVQYNAIFIPPQSRCGSRSVSPSVRLEKSFLKSPQVWTMDWLELLLWAGSPGKRFSAKHTVTRLAMCGWSFFLSDGSRIGFHSLIFLLSDVRRISGGGEISRIG